MNKIYKLFIVTLFAMFVTKANAEINFGVSAAITSIEASGTETEGGEKNSTDVDNLVAIPSVFIEYSLTDNISVGLDYIPITADVSNSTKTRTDIETSVTGTTTTTTTNRSQSAQAELSDHITLYANYGISDSLYLKGGVANVSLDTEDSLGTGSKYGNVDIMGIVAGVGIQNENMRVELVYTDYEDISLTSSVARTGVTTNNKIDADLDTLAFKISYAF